jgi:signal transduction histidine kinase
MLRDASDRRRADMQTLKAARADLARQEAEQALQRHVQVLHDGALDLRRALVRLQHSTQRLAKHPDDANRAAQVRVLEARADGVGRILDELIVGAALEAHTIELRPERVNLVPLIGRVVAEMRSRATPCRLNVAMPQGLTAHVDPARFEQVIRSLLEQAMARHPRGCWIDVELKRPLVGLARLEVREVGRPVTDAVRRRLLDTTEPPRRLALCRRIVEQHGGTLDVEFDQSAAGGVRISITMPTLRGRVPPTSSSG